MPCDVSVCFVGEGYEVQTKRQSIVNIRYKLKNSVLSSTNSEQFFWISKSENSERWIVYQQRSSGLLRLSLATVSGQGDGGDHINGVSGETCRLSYKLTHTDWLFPIYSSLMPGHSSMGWARFSWGSFHTGGLIVSRLLQRTCWTIKSQIMHWG